jgi:hypothetical protein
MALLLFHHQNFDKQLRYTLRMALLLFYHQALR